MPLPPLLICGIVRIHAKQRAGIFISVQIEVGETQAYVRPDVHQDAALGAVPLNHGDRARHTVLEIPTRPACPLDHKVAMFGPDGERLSNAVKTRRKDDNARLVLSGSKAGYFTGHAALMAFCSAAASSVLPSPTAPKLLTLTESSPPKADAPQTSNNAKTIASFLKHSNAVSSY